MQALTPWLIFLATAAVVVYAASKLAEYGDVIAVRTGLGGLLVGTILLAGATSLPEIIAAISSFNLGVPDLAAGNFFGSNMINMFLLALIDTMNPHIPLLRTHAISQTLTAGLATVLATLATLFVLANLGITIGWIGLGSIMLIVLYFAGVWLVRQEGAAAGGPAAAIDQPGPEFPSLWRGLIGFAIAAGVLVAAVPFLVQATSDIAEMTGLASSFVGTALLSIVTSLPELLAALAAVRMGATEMAVGNLFGSNVFNMLGLGLADFFYLQGSFLDDISDDFALVGIIGVLLTLMALMANLARIERRIRFIELDALAIFITYLLGMYLLYMRGMGV